MIKRMNVLVREKIFVCLKCFVNRDVIFIEVEKQKKKKNGE